MTNVYQNTKGGKLLEWKPKLERLGIMVPPSRIVDSPFDIAKAQAHLGGFGRLARKQGPFLPYAMLRDNGEPEGTGSGRSFPAFLDLQDDELMGALNAISRSNPKANGVLLQPFVGQPLFKDEYYGECYGPMISGVAYTQEATERKNAFVRLVYGHPSRAMEGKGTYVAFNPSNYKEEASKDYYPVFESYPMSVLVNKPDWDEKRNVRIETVIKSNVDISKFGGYWGDRDELFKNIFRHVIALGQYGPLYIEFALTCVNEKISFICLQICEFHDKLAGLQSEIQHSLESFGQRKTQAGVRKADEKRLVELYNAAVHDKNVIAAGFDVVGRRRQEFDRIIWRPKTCNYRDDLKFGKPPLVAYDVSDLGSETAEGFDNGGMVELTRPDKRNTFDVHRGGYCRARKIIGMGSVEYMPYKLKGISEQPIGDAANLLINCKAVFEVDSRIPFGTLRIESIGSVERFDE